MTEVLKTVQLTMRFGGLQAIDRLDLTMERGDIVALIGPNGAGKSTLFNCLTGFHAPQTGTMTLNSSRHGTVCLNGLKPNQVTEFGLARTFQNIRLFARMTVLENVMIGRHCRMRAGVAGAVIRNPRTRHEEKQIAEQSHAILERFQMDAYANEYAGNLPYGAQRRLEIARAMATEPVVLLLDEPAAGMNAAETRELDDMITGLRDREEISILLVEHDMKLVMRLADRICVLNYGRKIAEGSPPEVARNPDVIKAYLGEDPDA